MPRLDYKNCKGCGGHASEVGLLSWTRLCQTCYRERFEQNLDQLRAHDGPYFQHHRRACVAAFGGVLLDDVLREV
jgi:hypothetical protein